MHSILLPVKAEMRRADEWENHVDWLWLWRCDQNNVQSYFNGLDRLQSQQTLIWTIFSCFTRNGEANGRRRLYAEVDKYVYSAVNNRRNNSYYIHNHYSFRRIAFSPVTMLCECVQCKKRWPCVMDSAPMGVCVQWSDRQYFFFLFFLRSAFIYIVSNEAHRSCISPIEQLPQ